MINTLTLNPALDLNMHITTLEEGETNRSASEEIIVGGKGLNVSIVARNLGEDTKVFTMGAGFTGKKVAEYLEEEKFDYCLVELPEGFTRINIKLKGNKETEINGAGPDIPEASFNEMLNELNKIADGEILVMGGSLPKSLGDDGYAKIMAALSDRNIDIVVDSSKKALLNVLPYHPLLIKPNLDELGGYFGLKLTNKDEAIPYMRKLQEMGARNIICSMGGDGALMLTEEGEAYYSEAPKGKLVNSVGAGDSMVAGFSVEYSKSKNALEAFRVAVASGSATAFSPVLATKEGMEALLPNVNPVKL